MAQSIRLERGNYRRQFADFLDRLAISGVDRDEWSSFIIVHYLDEFLEEMRRCTVRLAIGELQINIDSDEARQILGAWAIAIRSSIHESN